MAGGRPYKPFDPKTPTVPRRDRHGRTLSDAPPFRTGTKAASAWAPLQKGFSPKEVADMLKVRTRTYVASVKHITRF